MTEIAHALHVLWDQQYATSLTPSLGFDESCSLIFENAAFQQSELSAYLTPEHSRHLDRAVRDELHLQVAKCISSDEISVRLFEIGNATYTVVLRCYKSLGAGTGAIVVASFLAQDLEANHSSAALENQLSELRQINHRVDTFLRTASHDLRLPVSNLKNFSRILVRTKSEQARDELAGRIVHAAEVLEDLLDGMMEIAESRNAPDEGGELVNLKEVIDDVLDVLNEQLVAADAVIRFSLDECELVYRSAFARSIVFNLLSNAIKYRSDDRRLELTVACKASTNGIWLSVSDNGIGMDLAQQKDKLFKPFKRISDEGAGKGVGLSLVKSFVEANHGEIRVESEVGVGTTFRLFLRSYEPEVKQYGLFD